MTVSSACAWANLAVADSGPPWFASDLGSGTWGYAGLTDLTIARPRNEVTAGASGEVFLYVNDAAQILPFLGPLGSFYKNNSGTAKITLQRMPLPPAPAK